MSALICLVDARFMVKTRPFTTRNEDIHSKINIRKISVFKREEDDDEEKICNKLLVLIT